MPGAPTLANFPGVFFCKYFFPVLAAASALRYQSRPAGEPATTTVAGYYVPQVFG